MPWRVETRFNALAYLNESCSMVQLTLYRPPPVIIDLVTSSDEEEDQPSAKANGLAELKSEVKDGWSKPTPSHTLLEGNGSPIRPEIDSTSRNPQVTSSQLVNKPDENRSSLSSHKLANIGIKRHSELLLPSQTPRSRFALSSVSASEATERPTSDPGKSRAVPSAFNISTNVVPGLSRPEPPKLVPSKRKPDPGSRPGDPEASSSSSDSVLGRGSRALETHERRGRALFSDLLQKAQSDYQQLDEDEDDQPPIKEVGQAGLREHAEGLQGAKLLSQRGLDLAEQEEAKAKSMEAALKAAPKANLSITSISVPSPSTSISDKGVEIETPFTRETQALDLSNAPNASTEDVLSSVASPLDQLATPSQPSSRPSSRSSRLVLETQEDGSADIDIPQPIKVPKNSQPARHHEHSSRSPPSAISPKDYPKDSLPDAKGAPFTRAECILIIYFAERKMPWNELDRKMGRTKNCCCTKYSRSGALKERYIQKELGYDQCVPFLDSQMPRHGTMKELLQTLRAHLGADADQKVATTPRVSQTTAMDSSSTLPRSTAPAFAVTQRAGSARPINERPALLRRDFEANKSFRLGDPLSPLSRPSSSGSIATDSEGPRLRERRNLKHYSYTAADFGRAVEDKLRESETPSVDTTVDNEDAPTIRKVEVSALQELLDLTVTLPTSQDGHLKPYLNLRERQLVHDKLRFHNVSHLGTQELQWDGVELHVPMSREELKALHFCLLEHLGSTHADLSSTINSKNEAWIRDFAFRAQEYLRIRSRQSIEAFLYDVRHGQRTQSTLQLGLAERSRSLQSSLVSRELDQRSDARTIRDGSMRDKLRDSLQPTASFTGTSGDVGTVAWSPDGNTFGAGSVCLVDPNSMQYNRSNNLLLSRFETRTLLELPDHCRRREKPAEGPNSTEAMHVTQDPRLFETVSMVGFSHDGDYLYSVGYDNFLQAYNVRAAGINKPVWSNDHGAEIDLLTIASGSSSDAELLATGCKNVEAGMRIFRRHGDTFEMVQALSGNKAITNKERRVYPAAMKFGVRAWTQTYLLAGFSTNLDNPQNFGEICLYDVSRHAPIQITPASGNVFDCAWSPSSFHCAVARTAVSNQVSRGTKSQILVFRPDQDAFKSFNLNFECPALDINDVVFCPYNYNYVAAGATDGKIYIWDQRNPDTILHTFRHGPPCMEIDRTVRREQVDTGVRFTGWSYNRNRLYTGSSDGIVKTWDIHRAPEDAFLRDVVSLNSGIMSGAFSKDYTRLLLGEVNGSITILESSLETRTLKDMDTFSLQQSVTNEDDAGAAPVEAQDSGRQLSKAARRSKEIKYRPMGAFPVRQAVQGRHYQGPYDHAPDAGVLRFEAARFQRRLKEQETEEKCAIPECGRAAQLVTGEEKGDSGRWRDRIPQAIRDAQGRKISGTMIPGMLKCSHCGRPARPRVVDEDEQERFPLCERCGFGCFSCGKRAKMDVTITEMGCKDCGLRWKVGALGYTLIEEERCRADRMEGVDGQEMVAEHDKANTCDEEGDVYGLLEYYHGLWEDKQSED